MKTALYGLVVCGGQSSRMGTDKSLVDYHGKPQRYYVYDMLEWICDRVYISCNESQATSIPSPYLALTDLADYRNIGPMAALLTAFNTFPGTDFLVTGCDYPYITLKDLKGFVKTINKNNVASAFYKKDNSVYEPLLAWYSHLSAPIITEMFVNGQYSLQHFLRENGAEKFESSRPQNVVSVDTPEEYLLAKNRIVKKIH